MNRTNLACVILALSLCVSSAGAEYAFVASSYLGSAAFDDTVVGACIGEDGTIVLAANLGSEAINRLRVSAGGTDEYPADRNGCVLRLGPAGDQVLSVSAVAHRVSDMAMDGKGRLYLAAGAEGLLVMDDRAATVVRRVSVNDCRRVDVAPDGHCAVIAGDEILIFDPAGGQIGRAPGRGYTNDVCIHGPSRTVIFCGFRNADAWEGTRVYPVQICYIYGLDYTGQRTWTNYDWSTDRNSDRFLNKPTNNMADTRADRCAIGHDGRLYVTFQVAGGNHIFRYSPKDIMTPVELAGGDRYHQFFNSRSEHKNFFARYDPATGEFLAGQQFCGRLGNGRANAVVTKDGGITADEEGRVYILGKAAYGIPVTLMPDASDYRGGGFILVMSPDLKERLVCTRPCGGKGSPHAVDARTIGAQRRTVFGGSGMAEGMFTKNALQDKPADVSIEKGGPQDGFFAVLAE